VWDKRGRQVKDRRAIEYEPDNIGFGIAESLCRIVLCPVRAGSALMKYPPPVGPKFHERAGGNPVTYAIFTSKSTVTALRVPYYGGRNRTGPIRCTVTDSAVYVRPSYG
jgi:hypothetical protein